ncbi:MAG: PqqD family protein [Sphingomicrobium sp.]
MSEPVYKLSGKAMFTSVGGDIVALNIDDGQCYGMEKVTATVWRLLETPMSLDEICDRLAAMYAVDTVTCRNEVDRLFAQLQSEGLVELVQPGA